MPLEMEYADDVDFKILHCMSVSWGLQPKEMLEVMAQSWVAAPTTLMDMSRLSKKNINIIFQY